GILGNFPEGMRTRETAILFFQYVMARLKRPGGRCGVVLPNGFLFGTGVAAQVKKTLLERFNLHTIVRLPNGVFAPYTDIPTNLPRPWWPASSRRSGASWVSWRRSRRFWRHPRTAFPPRPRTRGRGVGGEGLLAPLAPRGGEGSGVRGFLLPSPPYSGERGWG